MSDGLELVAQVWEAVKYHIDTNDRPEAADDLVNLLIDHDHEVSEIKEAFRGDKVINAALRGYIASHEDPDDEDPYDEDHDDPYLG